MSSISVLVAIALSWLNAQRGSHRWHREVYVCGCKIGTIAHQVVCMMQGDESALPTIDALDVAVI